MKWYTLYKFNEILHDESIHYDRHVTRGNFIPYKMYHDEMLDDEMIQD